MRVGAILVVGFGLSDCGGSSDRYSQARARYGENGEHIPKGGGSYRVGRPYMIAGRVFFPAEDPNYRADGVASWYGPDFHGSRTANGEIYNMHALTAAHPTLPMPSYVRVTNRLNQRSVIVRVNDRGPFRGGRVIDVSVKTAHLLGFHSSGLAPVLVEYVGRAPLEGSDDRVLEATLRSGEPAPAPSTTRVAGSRPAVREEPARTAASRPGAPEQPVAAAFIRGTRPPLPDRTAEIPARSSAYAPVRPEVPSFSSRGLY